MSVEEEKRKLRRQVLAGLQAIPAEQRNSRSAALRSRLGDILSTPGSLNVALYAALPHEVDLLPLLQEYPQHRYAFPRCGPGGSMHFHIVSQAGTELHPGAMGIPTPAADLPVLPPQELQVIIVPGVAFSTEGARLGYGGGYYDRYLPRCPQAVILSVLFPEQLVASIPTAEHDLRIPHLITP